MDTNTGEVEGSGEELTGRKKSRFKLLKSRLFGRLKRKETEGLMKQSQSASDVTADVIAPGNDDSEDDFLGGLKTLGSRALSHDSIFLADQSQSSSEPTRVLSQENVHGRIRELQLKLQQQNMRLGPPPLLIPGKRMEDSGTTSEDDGLPQSPPEISFHDRTAHGPSKKFPDTHRHHSSLSLAGTGSEEEEQCLSLPSSRPLSPNPASPCDLGPSPEVDFTSPAQYTPSLDSSAARHRMSVKPRNQRASSKGRNRLSKPRSESLSDLDPDQPLSEREEEQDGMENEEREEEEREEEDERERLFSSSSKDSGFAEKEKPWQSVPPGGLKEVLQRQESSEPEGRVTTNPLYLQAMSLAVDLSSVPEPMTKTSILETPSPLTPPSAPVEEPQKPTGPIRVKRPSIVIHTHPSQDKRDIQACSDQESCPGSTSENTLSRPLSPVYGSDNVTYTTNQLPSKEKPEENMTPATSNKRDRLRRNTQCLSLADTSSSTHHSALPTPDPRAKRQRPASERESVRETTAVPPPDVNEDNPKLDLVQRTTGQEDTLPGANSFSTSSLRQRSKSATGSAHAGTRDEEMNGEVKGGEGLVAKNPYQGSVRRQEVKPEKATFKGLKENQSQPWSQERKAKTEVEVVEETGLKGGQKRDGQSERKEEKDQEQEMRSAFGVKLRTTSQSLKYRLQRDQEFRVESHSVKVIGTTTAEPVKGEIDTSSKVRGDLANKALRKGPSQVSDCPPYTPDRNRLKENQDDDDDTDLVVDAFLDPDKGLSSRPALGLPKGAETPGSNGSAGLEPVWMSMAREKTRSLQQHLIPVTEPGTGGTTTPQYTPSPRPAPTPTPQPRLQPTSQPSTQPPSQSQPSTKTASQKQTSPPVVQPPSQPIPSTRPILQGLQLTAKLKTLPSDQPNTQTASQLTPQGTAQQLTQPSSQPHMPTRPTLRGASERSSTSLKRAEKMPVEKWTDRALSTGTMGESSNFQFEIHTTKPEIPSSSCPSSSSLSQRGQPTWMELAKRKSLAWSDKTMD